MAYQKYGLKDYNTGSSMQQHAALAYIPHLLENLNSVALLTSNAIKIVDYGCSEGYNSMTFFNTLLRLFRENNNQEVFVTHTDLPDNDWGIVHNLINTSEDSYLNLPNTFYSTIGRSFFQQILPNNSVHLGFSAFAFHYLSRKPIRKPNDTAMIHEALKEQGKIDILTILNHRINELAPGGILTIIASGSDKNTTEKLYTFILHSMRNLVAKGIMTEDSLQKFELTIYKMNINEWNEALETYRDRIETIKVEMNEQSSPVYQKFLEDNDFDKYRDEIVRAVAIIGRPLLLSMLENSEEEAEILYKAFVEELRNLITEPVNHKFLVALVMIRKLM